MPRSKKPRTGVTTEKFREGSKLELIHEFSDEMVLNPLRELDSKMIIFKFFFFIVIKCLVVGAPMESRGVLPLCHSLFYLLDLWGIVSLQQIPEKRLLVVISGVSAAAESEQGAAAALAEAEKRSSLSVAELAFAVAELAFSVTELALAVAELAFSEAEEAAPLVEISVIKVGFLCQ